ncbi:lytic transglycosylase [Trinickia dabaoshanensis]|uniref:Lytic transglycosylase n=1 Tax=Trinickia dabaoshanensis TaxID=564714 RepID=A0A2N7VLY9_9BURK|nr:lytic transglycosylase domain-containing protein [Trinickia dabaoshanensis]PMS18174.1 lytic transglycosylase [Trinickia dabaoshanensis]
MRRWLWLLALQATLLAGAAHAADFLSLAQRCAPQVDPHTMAAIVSVESGYNPYAIGVVGGHLVRQPASEAEALATVRMLTRLNYNFSLGLAQVNRYNLARYGETVETIFEPCANLRAAAAILSECFTRAVHVDVNEQAALRKAISCYYSGNFSTGFTQGYVERVVDHAGTDVSTEVAPIPLARGSSPGRPAASRGSTDDARAAGGKSTHTALALSRGPGRSRCSPGIVVISDCESDGLRNNGSIKILH